VPPRCWRWSASATTPPAELTWGQARTEVRGKRQAALAVRSRFARVWAEISRRAGELTGAIDQTLVQLRAAGIGNPSRFAGIADPRDLYPLVPEEGVWPLHEAGKRLANELSHFRPMSEELELAHDRLRTVVARTTPVAREYANANTLF